MTCQATLVVLQTCSAGLAMAVRFQCGKCLSPSSGRGAQKKLDDLIDRGVIRSSDLDNRTMDALEGAPGSFAPLAIAAAPCITSHRHPCSAAAV